MVVNKSKDFGGDTEKMLKESNKLILQTAALIGSIGFAAIIVMIALIHYGY